jgi:acyl-CoA hydrolase
VFPVSSLFVLYRIRGVRGAGQIMAWMDLCAGIAAKRHCRGPVVTASMDDLHFRDVAKLGEVTRVAHRTVRTCALPTY